MKTIRERLDGKVWKAIKAMIDGLEYQDKREGFEVNMEYFGNQLLGTCFGCAATCAIQQIAQIDFISTRTCEIESTDGRAEALGFEVDDLDDFEEAINSLRLGNECPLFGYMCKMIVQPDQNLPMLRTESWRENLGPYKAYMEQLKKLDI